MINMDTLKNNTVLKEKTALKKSAFFNKEMLMNPYPVYDRLRTEMPVYKAQGFMGTEWFCTRYNDVRQVLTDNRFLTDPLPQRIQQRSAHVEGDIGFDALTKTIGQWLFFLDPPDNGRIRQFMNKSFITKAIENWRGFIDTTVNDLFASIKTEQEINALESFADPLPALVSTQLLGLPQADFERLLWWSQELFWVFDQPMSLQGYAHLNQIASEFSEYFRELFVLRRKHPQNDLLSHLLTTTINGEQLTEDEVLSTCAMIFTVGQETTATTIGSGFMLLAQHPQQQEQLRKNPGLLHNTTEEILRYESPVQAIARVPVEDVDIGGYTIHAGERVVASLGAANRDPLQFKQADQFDVSRPVSRNLGFGGGVHYCLGSNLARMMCQCIFHTATQKFSKITLANPAPAWRSNFIIRSLKQLTIVLQK